MLDFLGRIGKGWATVSGLVVAALAAFLGADVGTMARAVLDNLWNLLLGVGGLLVFFGVGRKAGVVAAVSGAFHKSGR